MPGITLQPIRVATDDDGEGMLMLLDDRLVGVLVRLSTLHGDIAGRWFLEASFGRALDVITRPVFEDLYAAKTWAMTQASSTL